MLLWQVELLQRIEGKGSIHCWKIVHRLVTVPWHGMLESVKFIIELIVVVILNE